MLNSKLPFGIAFVSGAPRSGTTIAHALICTSGSVNSYISECSYFSQLVRAFDRGMETFDFHTRYYFNNQRDYADLHRRLLAEVLSAHWQHLGRPDTLVLKDPDMLPIIPSVAALVETSKFVVLYRDPLDVIASRLQVQRRRDPNSDIFHPDNIAGLAQEYVSGYQAIDGLAASEPSRVLVQKYEALIDQDFDALQHFLKIEDVDASQVWKKSSVDQETFAGDAWNSQLYFKPVSKNSIGSYRMLLQPETIRLIETLCGPTVERLHKLSSSNMRR